MKSRSRAVFILLALLTLAMTIFGGTVLLRRWQDSRQANISRELELYVYPSMGADEVLAELVASSAVRNPRSLARSFKDKQVDEFLQPGHYLIPASSPSVYVARMLNNGWQTPVRLTLSGNLRIKSNIAAKIASQLLLDSTEVYSALNDDALLSEYGTNSRDVFSLLIPDTYEIYWTASMRDFLAAQKSAYDAFWTEERKLKASRLGLSRQEVSILASIVKGETNYEPEMPKIAGVYLNRLKAGWPLQADPTVAFCFGYSLTRVLNKHLEVDSPYNTYRHQGLPPGPICVPTKAALDAVLNPDFGGEWGKGNFYFCANADFSGTHSFARTLAEHNRNADAFRRELSRRQKQK